MPAFGKLLVFLRREALCYVVQQCRKSELFPVGVAHSEYSGKLKALLFGAENMRQPLFADEIYDLFSECIAVHCFIPPLPE